MPDDVTATAVANGVARRSESAALVAADDSGRLVRWRELAQGSWFSTNVSADKLIAFDRAKEVLDTRRIPPTHGDGPEPDAPADEPMPQVDWWPRRTAFEDLWQHGRRFLYGAVNAGGLGAAGFGPFCLVSNPEAPTPDALAVFPADSAQRYTNLDAVVDRERAKAEATAWADRADLAVTQLGQVALSVEEQDWPDRLCGAERYLEVVRAGRFLSETVAEVRVTTGYLWTLAELRLRHVAGEPLDDLERNQAAAYDVLGRWRRTDGVTVVTVG